MPKFIRERPVGDRRKRFVLWLALLALLTTGSAPAAAASRAPDGSAWKGWAISDFRIEGLSEDLVKQLRPGLSLTGTRKLFRVKRPPFFPKHLDEDLRRVRLFLSQQGYPRATVTPRFEPADAAREVAIVFAIDPGLPVRIAGVEIVTPSPMDGGRLTKDLPLRDGDLFVDSRVLETGRLLERGLQEVGHARPRVVREVTPLDSVRVKVRFDVEPGPVHRFGDLICEGLPADLVPLARRTVELRTGDRYSPDALPDARTRLRLLGLFRQIRLGLEEAEGDTLDVRADLIPRDFRILETGVGYWSDELLKLKMSWRHLNLLRAGRGVELKGGYSRFRQSAAASLWWPSLFGSRTRGTLGTELVREREDSYRLFSREVTFSALYRFDLESQVQARLSFADINLDSRIAGEAELPGEDGLLGTLSLSWQRSRVDDPIYPRRGGTLRLRGEIGLPGSLSESHYLLGEGAVATHRSLPADLVVVGRAGLGLAAPMGGSTELLANKRLFGGGIGSMRGFKRRRLGPRDAMGVPSGGRARLEASLELRFPIAGKLHGALFTDAGQVWDDRSDLSVDDLEWAVGPALFLQTPVGPLRADFARLLTDGAGGDSRSVFHISIGHPF